TSSSPAPNAAPPGTATASLRVLPLPPELPEIPLPPLPHLADLKRRPALGAPTRRLGRAQVIAAPKAQPVLVTIEQAGQVLESPPPRADAPEKPSDAHA